MDLVQLSAIVIPSLINITAHLPQFIHFHRAPPGGEGSQSFMGGGQQLKPLRGPLDGLSGISVVVCLGPDGGGVYANGIRISSQLERRLERPPPLTRRGRLALRRANPQETYGVGSHRGITGWREGKLLSRKTTVNRCWAGTRHTMCLFVCFRDEPVNVLDREESGAKHDTDQLGPDASGKRAAYAECSN